MAKTRCSFYLGGLNISAGSKLRLSGPRPVIIAVNGDVVVSGSLDVGSQLDGGRNGAGVSSGCGRGRGADGAASGDGLPPAVGGCDLNMAGGGGGGGVGRIRLNAATGCVLTQPLVLSPRATSNAALGCP